MTHYQFSVEYSETLVRDAVRTFLRHRLKRMWTLWFGMLLLAAGLITLLLVGDRSWFLGLVGGALGFCILLLWLLYRAHLTNSLGQLRKMKAPKAEFELQDESLRITSGSGAATVPWSAIQEILISPAFWLLCTAPNQFFTLPTPNVPQEALEFIRARVRTSQGPAKRAPN